MLPRAGFAPVSCTTEVCLMARPQSMPYAVRNVTLPPYTGFFNNGYMLAGCASRTPATDSPKAKRVGSRREGSRNYFMVDYCGTQTLNCNNAMLVNALIS